MTTATRCASPPIPRPRMSRILPRSRSTCGSAAAFTDGFVGKIRDRLRPEEVNTLPDGLLLITLELAARFLTDYLDGDRYFKIRTGGHNLVRARNQIALAQVFAERWTICAEIVAQQAIESWGTVSKKN